MSKHTARAPRATPKAPPGYSLSRKCTALTRAGKPCTAPRVRGTELCILHTPGAASRAGKIGGRPRIVYDVSKLKQFPPAETTTDVRKMMAHRLNEVTAGTLDPELGTKLFYMASCLLRAAEQEAIETVKAELEVLRAKVIGTRKASGV